MSKLRSTAATVLTKVIKEGQSLTFALDTHIKPLAESKDKAFIQSLCYGVLRQYHRLDFILKQLLTKPLRNKDTDIKVLLLIGLYQLKYMRVKPHAAVSETVAVAKKKYWAKSLVNAVLRQYGRKMEALEQQADLDKEAFYAHPSWLINKIQADWPEQAGEIFLANNQQPPMVLRVNLAQTNQKDYLKVLAEHSITAHAVEFSSSAIILDTPLAVEKLPGFTSGKVSVQDASAQLAAQLLDLQSGQSALDLCAAPGGKTAAILERHSDLSALWAVDINKNRSNRIKENLQRLHLKAKVLVADATKPDEWSQGQLFDRIVVDTPCSALGVIRRHPDIKLLRRETDIDALCLLQKQILNAAWDVLAPKGVLLYATCSILKQENELQIESFLKHHVDASEVPINEAWGVESKFGRQILTGNSEMDGFYYARLIKQ